MNQLNKKIRVAYYVVPFIIGGMERFLFNLVNYIDRKKFEPIIISHAQGETISLFKSLGVQIKIIDFNFPKGFKKLIDFLGEYKFDIAQSNYFNPALAMASSAARVPHIWYVGGYIHSVNASLNLRQRKGILNIMFILSKKVICASNFIKQEFEDVGVKKTKIIYSGVDFDEIDNTYPDYGVRNKSGCSDGLAIGMVAHFISFKRHIDFIHAAKRVKRCLPNSKFFIIGTTYPNKEGLDYAKYLYKTVKDMGMDKDILFTGFRKDILKTIARMDLVVLPSIGEGLGLAILEAMGCGKPVVGSNSGGLKEIVVNKKTGLLVPPKNPNKLAEAMIEILKDPKRARSMGEAGRKRARRLFDITKSVRQYEELYQKVYNESTKPRKL